MFDNQPKATASGLAILLLLTTACGRDPEKVTFYHTYGYQEGDNWKIPLKARVYEPSDRARAASEVTMKIAQSLSPMGADEEKNLKFRLGELLADNEQGEIIAIRFKDDAKDYSGQDWVTNQYGMMTSTLELSDSTVTKLLQAQNSKDGWLTFNVTSPDHTGEGRVRMIPAEGVSVISDIDDTIKITELPAGFKTVVNNTFFRKFQAVSERETLYEGLEGASFHYVSGSPWQLNKPLMDFLFKEEKFPEGSFHMSDVVQETREILKNPTQALYEMATGGAGDGIFEQKVRQITEIMTRFPRHRFVLIGDSGECDPEVYTLIRGKTELESRIAEIRIRDVVGDWTNDCRKDATKCTRLRGMKVIQAETVPEGKSKAVKEGCPSSSKNR